MNIKMNEGMKEKLIDRNNLYHGQDKIIEEI